MTIEIGILLIVIYVISAVLFWYLGASSELKKPKRAIDLSGKDDGVSL